MPHFNRDTAQHRPSQGRTLRLDRRVAAGEEVILAKAGKPVVRLVSYSGPAHPRIPGALKGRIRIAPDFDTLPADIAEAAGACPGPD